MTVEQSMQRLKEHKILFSHDHGWDETTIQALDIAIKSLDMWNKFSDEIGEVLDKRYCEVVDNALDNIEQGFFQSEKQ